MAEPDNATRQQQQLQQLPPSVGASMGPPQPCPFLRSMVPCHKKAKQCLGLAAAITSKSDIVFGRFEDKSVRFFDTNNTEEISICKGGYAYFIYIYYMREREREIGYILWFFNMNYYVFIN